ncbi:MAG: S41 family peptidase [Nitrospirota bacterium]
MKKRGFWFWNTVFITIFSIGILIGIELHNKVFADNDTTFEKLKVFTEVLSVIEKNYVEEVDSKELVYNAIRGMIKPLDPHSGFLSPDVFKETQVDTKGKFGGVGIQIGIKDKKLMVIAPIEDTPAKRAGMKAGDYIIKVDGEQTKDMSLMDVVQKIRGEKGTDVVLTVIREGEDNPIDFTITRDIIRIKSVKREMLESDVGYIKITQFQEHTAGDLRNALDKLKEEGMQSLILDLRNNPGGLLNSAVEVTENFIEEGKLIVFMKGKNGKLDEFYSHNRTPGLDYQMVVLVNGGSASASEIVSGALQDWGRAVVLGTQSFGKGSVQTVLPLSDGSGLRLTTAKYYTPKERVIQNVGITPDIIVSNIVNKDGEEKPRLREKDLERHLKGKGEEDVVQKDKKDITINKKEEDKKEKDQQLQKAIEILKAWRIFKGVDSIAKE